MNNKNQAIINSAILISVFAFFALNATGLIGIQGQQFPYLQLNLQGLFYTSTGSLIQQRLLSQEFLILLAAGVSVSVFVPFLKPVNGMVVGIAVLLVVFGLSRLSYDNAMLPIEYSILTLVILYMLNVLLSYFVEIHARQQLMTTFSQYIPPQLVRQLNNTSGDVSVDGEGKILTVVFTDLQNFTGISEQLNPKQLNLLLNEYFDAMTGIIFKYEGTIDKYIGDAIMSFWNAPFDQPGHAGKAVAAALEMQVAMQELSSRFVSRGWPALAMGIGINTGRAHVGNIGSRYRLNYTAIGDAVNLASRLETLTRIYRVPVIISEETRKLIPDVVCRELDNVRVKGKTQQTRIYQPLCLESEINDSTREKLDVHQQALELLYNGNTRGAEKRFRALYDEDRTDKYYKAMVKKILNENQPDHSPR